MSMATKHCRMATYLDELLPINSHDHFIMWSLRDKLIFLVTVHMATKICSMVICLEKFLIIKSYNVLIFRFYKVMWETKTIESTTKVPMVTKLSRMATYMTHMTLWSRGFLRSCDKGKLLYLHYHSAQGNQRWCDGHIPLEACNNKVP